MTFFTGFPYVSSIIQPFPTNLNTLDQSWLLISLLGATLLILFLPLQVYISYLKHEFSRSQKVVDVLKSLLNNETKGWAWATFRSDSFEASKSFLDLLNLNPDHPVLLIDILNAFQKQDATILEQNIIQLYKYKQPFKHDLQTDESGLFLNISGHMIETPIQKILILKVVNPGDNFSKKYKDFANLQNERKMLHQILDKVPYPIWFRDEEMHLKYCNSAYAKMIETTPKEAVKNSLELLPINRKGSPYQLSILARKSEELQSQRLHLVIEGYRRYVEISELPLDETSKTIGYLHDITELSEAQTLLAKNVEAYHEILQQIATPIAVYGSDTRLNFFNSSFQKLYQLNESWLYSRPLYVEIVEDLRKRRKLPEQRDFQVFKRERLNLFKSLIQPMQELVYLPDGQTLRMMISPHPLGGLLYLFDDVTDKLTLERKFNTLIAVQKETLNNLHEGVLVFGSDNRLRLSNPSIATLWNLSAIDLAPGRHISEVLSSIDIKYLSDEQKRLILIKLNELIENRKSFSRKIFCDNQSVIDMGYIPLPDGSHLFRFVDISNHYHIEQALNDKNQALAKVDKIKTEFINHLSQELEQPLQSVKGFSTLMMDECFGKLNEKQKEYCHEIHHISEELLDFLRKMSGLSDINFMNLNFHPTVIQLPEMIKSLRSLLEKKADQNGIELHVENKCRTKNIKVDENHLKQALYRLLHHSISSIPSGGQVAFKTYQTKENGKLHVCFEITENHGLEEGKSDIKFEGRQLKDQDYTIIRALIELHGGEFHPHEDHLHYLCRIPLNA